MDTRQTPPLCRSSMVYRPFEKITSISETNKLLRSRRTVLFIFVIASMGFAANRMTTILNLESSLTLKCAIIGIFTLLFGWIAFSFWVGVMGFVNLMRTKDPLGIHQLLADKSIDILPGTKIAIVMPVYNEEVVNIFAGLQTMYESLQKTGRGDLFDFYVLSDSDQAQQGRQEEKAWGELCERVQGFGKIFYRRRKLRIHKKSGNISDFCRRWGKNYKYMIPLDADSLMSGRVFVDMVKVMEARSGVGILQTAPKGINQKSLGSRMNQFASHLYGPLLLSGSHFWQLDESGFWGHNAIIRMEPFMKFCALPTSRGSLPFGGEILSHDFVEAALMRRAGWGVWLAYDMNDSYEELPPSLFKELERDSRWCRGNIQHLSMVFMKGVTFGHRLQFLSGNMFYFSAFFWFMLLVLTTVYGVMDFLHQPVYFPVAHGLFPMWPVRYLHLSIQVLTVTAVFLFFPKILSLVWVVLSRQSHLYGGILKMTASVILETLSSVLLSPIRMLFHSSFVIMSLLGGRFDWRKQSRHLERISFWQAFRAHWWGSVLAFLWAFLALAVNQTLFLWISLIAIPLFFAIPITMIMSSRSIGAFVKSRGLFLSPVETQPPAEVIRYNQLVGSQA
jgi:membrane glycosyltransferase